MKKKSFDKTPNERSRSMRSDEERVFDEREANLEPVFNMDFQDPTYVPKEYIPEGYNYRWVRMSVHGIEDRSRMVEMKRKGWTVVPASRHPDMMFDDFFGNGGKTKGYIEYKGSILCERLKKYCDQEHKMYERLNFEKMTSMPGTENFMSEPGMHTKSYNDTFLGRGRSFS